MEEQFCAKVRAMGASCITISHKPALVAFHDAVLSLDGEGGWSVHFQRDSAPCLHEIRNDESGNEIMKTECQSDALTMEEVFASTKGVLEYVLILLISSILVLFGSTQS
ncbi:hypothetical protein SUGI_0193350 [Cryptomeria japonica]|nr:hypothetical protein SUGI_0193350 [Cryptomeria japonica]